MDTTIDKVYIDGPCVLNVLLARFERVSDVTHFCKDTIQMCDSLSLRLSPGTSLFQFLQYEWAREFPDNKKCSANNLYDILIFLILYATDMIHVVVVYNIVNGMGSLGD